MTDPNKQMGVIKKNRTLLLYENRNRQHNTELKTRKHVNVQRRVCQVKGRYGYKKTKPK